MTQAIHGVEGGADRVQLQTLDHRTPVEPRPPGYAVPLTADQRHFFKVLIRSDPQQGARSVRMCVSATRITGPLSLALLERSLTDVRRRHESLRTTFKALDGVMTQHIDPPGPYELTCIDLAALPTSKAESEARRLTMEFQDQAIDLANGPLFEARVLKLATQEHVLIVLADHLICDGMSNTLLDNEIWRAYDAGGMNEPALVSLPALQFADYAVWSERTAKSRRAEHEAYWGQQRIEWAPTVIPVSPECEGCPETGPMVHVSFGSALTAELRQVAERQQASLSNVMLAIYASAMSTWCDTQRLVIRLPVHGRHGGPELSDVIGFFASFVCLRIEIDRRRRFQDLLAIVREEVRDAIAHRDLDRMIETVPACLQTELEFHWRSARRSGRAVKIRRHADELIKRQPFLIRSPGTQKWHLKFWCVFNETPADVCVTIRYRASSIRPAAVEKFVSDMRAVARNIIDGPSSTSACQDSPESETYDATR